MPATYKHTVAMSSDGRYFRRITPDGHVERKYLGFQWETHEPPKMEPKRISGYFETLKKCGWKVWVE